MAQISLAELEEKLGYAPTPQGFEKTQALIACNQNNNAIRMSPNGELLPALTNEKSVSQVAAFNRNA